MNIQEIKADMILNNLYFKEFKFARNKEILDGEYNIEINRSFEKVEEEYVVTMPISITKEDFRLSLTAVGHFEFTTNIEDISVREGMIKNNAAAIIFPFIRSQIAQITAQPGMMPIVLPAINVTKITD